MSMFKLVLEKAEEQKLFPVIADVESITNTAKQSMAKIPRMILATKEIGVFTYKIPKSTMDITDRLSLNSVLVDGQGQMEFADDLPPPGIEQEKEKGLR